MCVCVSRPNPHHKTTTAGTFLNVCFSKRFFPGLGAGTFHNVHFSKRFFLGLGRTWRYSSLFRSSTIESMSTLQSGQREKNGTDEDDAMVLCFSFFAFPFFFENYLSRKQFGIFKVTDYRLRKYAYHRFSGNFANENYRLSLSKKYFGNHLCLCLDLYLKLCQCPWGFHFSAFVHFPFRQTFAKSSCFPHILQVSHQQKFI